MSGVAGGAGPFPFRDIGSPILVTSPESLPHLVVKKDGAFPTKMGRDLDKLDKSSIFWGMFHSIILVNHFMGYPHDF